MRNFYVYMLRCRDGSYYTGHTDNLDGRIDDHQTGKTKCYTSTCRPVELVYAAKFPSRYEALSAKGKSKSGPEKRKKL